MEEGGLMIVISQSGETADTLAALRHARAEGQKIAAVVNVPTSTMAREADLLLPTNAGPEIGVASTKAFTCQLAVLAAFAANLARAQGRLDAKAEKELEIGRASCRERVCQYVWISLVAVSLKKQNNKMNDYT